jgi:hypothetical protein
MAARNMSMLHALVWYISCTELNSVNMIHCRWKLVRFCMFDSRTRARISLSLNVSKSYKRQIFILKLTLRFVRMKLCRNSYSKLGIISIWSFVFFCNPVLFVLCTSTFSKLCKTCTVAFRRVLSSAPL